MSVLDTCLRLCWEVGLGKLVVHKEGVSANGRESRRKNQTHYKKVIMIEDAVRRSATQRLGEVMEHRVLALLRDAWARGLSAVPPLDEYGTARTGFDSG